MEDRHATMHGLFRGTRPLVFVTNLDDPDEGRVFVWAWTSWFERIEASSGAVEFTPISTSEKELRESLLQQNEPDLYELELDTDYARDVIQEFLNETPLFPEAPETSSEAPFQEQDPVGDMEHE